MFIGQVLKRDVFVECNALELKGEYVGHTAPKVVGTVRSALGGCLFLDEVSTSGRWEWNCFKLTLARAA